MNLLIIFLTILITYLVNTALVYLFLRSILTNEEIFKALNDMHLLMFTVYMITILTIVTSVLFISFNKLIWHMPLNL